MNRKAKYKIKVVQERVAKNLKDIAFESVILTLFLLFISIVLASNIIRVIGQGRSNYDTYLEEKGTLDDLKDKNQSLQEELEYVNGDEFKKIVLRDTLRMGESGEHLYRTKSDAVYLDEELSYLDLAEKKSYLDWWIKLMN
jgi:hypothetical protein